MNAVATTASRTTAATDPELRDEVRSLLARHGPTRRSSRRRPGPSRADLMVDDEPSRIGKQIGSYTFLEEIGRGGMGVVYAARDERLGRMVALKALPPEYTRDRRHRDRLAREARAAAAFTHESIATVYALEEIDGELFIVSELVPGETLAQRARARPARGRSAGVDARRHRFGTLRGARARHHPPRPEAGERHPPHRRPHQDPRLRPRARRRSATADGDAVDRAGHGAGHAWLHGAGAGERRRDRRANGSLRVRRGRVGARDRRAPVRIRTRPSMLARMMEGRPATLSRQLSHRRARCRSSAAACASRRPSAIPSADELLDDLRALSVVGIADRRPCRRGRGAGAVVVAVPPGAS